MLNELASIRAGLLSAGIEFEAEHPDVQAVGKSKRPILVRLGQGNTLSQIELLPEGTGPLWTFREGKHNSFPLVSAPPLLDLTEANREELGKAWKDSPVPQRRAAMAKAASGAEISGGYRINPKWNTWPGDGLRASLERRLQGLAGLASDAGAIPTAIRRFLAITEDSRRDAFINHLIQLLVRESKSGIEDWLHIAHTALVGAASKKKVLGGDFYFDVASGEFGREARDPLNRTAAATALSAAAETERGRCAISGASCELHRGNFPQTNFPGLGLSYLFSKNEDLRASGSYRRFGDSAFPVGRSVAGELAGAVAELINPARKGITWRTLPGERQKTTDLFIAFVEGVPDAPVAGLFAPVEDDDGDTVEMDGVAVYERRATRLIDALEGLAPEDFRKTPVQALLLRKVDEGNRKALFHRRLNTRELFESAQRWAAAQRNLPQWLSLQTRGRRQRPAALTPLSIPLLTRKQFVRGGTQATDAVGLPAAEALSLFLGEGDVLRRARRVLSLVLKGHARLLEAMGHVNHGARIERGGRGGGPDMAAALRALTFLGVLLQAMGRAGGSWMSDTAFRLGQLLSVADTVHAGYCADVRQNKVPPALLGNSVLAMAQSNPARALAALGRRWKPYGSWAKRASLADAKKLRDSSDPKQRDAGYRIAQAIWQHRRAAELTRKIHGELPQSVDDVFRAELLMGYVAGLPPAAATGGDRAQESEEEAQSV